MSLQRQFSGDMEKIFAKVCKDSHAELIEFEGVDDHAHLLVNYPPKIAVWELVNSLKGVSSRRFKQKYYHQIKDKLWGKVCGLHHISLKVAVVTYYHHSTVY